MLFLGPKGLAAFAILYTLGNIAAFGRLVTITFNFIFICYFCLYNYGFVSH